jgi:restriction system protein
MARIKQGGNRFATYFPAVLDALRSLGGSGTPPEVTNWIAESLKLEDDVLNAVHKTGASVFYNDVAWARKYLAYEGMLDISTRGVWRLTEKGAKAHVSVAEANKIIQTWSAIFRERKDRQASVEVGEDDRFTDLTPPISDSLPSRSLIEILRDLPPTGFEHLCKRLLRESGFHEVNVTKQSGDGGIDGNGILQVNPLVSMRVLFQCKRYAGVVGSGEMRDFRGAMTGRTDKGIFLTTGIFSAEAKKEASREGAPPIELVDGDRLVRLFESLELGVIRRVIYEPDEQFFAEFR